MKIMRILHLPVCRFIHKKTTNGIGTVSKLAECFTSSPVSSDSILSAA